MARGKRLAQALAAGALLLCCCASLTHGTNEQQRQKAEEQLFQQLDANKVRLGATAASSGLPEAGSNGQRSWVMLSTRQAGLAGPAPAAAARHVPAAPTRLAPRAPAAGWRSDGG